MSDWNDVPEEIYDPARARLVEAWIVRLDEMHRSLVGQIRLGFREQLNPAIVEQALHDARTYVALAMRPFDPWPAYETVYTADSFTKPAQENQQ